MENKKAYIKPALESETFVPQSYCNTCESGVTYWFECNAGSSISGRNKVYQETNGIEGLQTEGWGSDWLRSESYYACNKKHEVKKSDTFRKGYVVHDGIVENVLIWRGDGVFFNTHCTTKLNEDEWEIAKS